MRNDIENLDPCIVDRTLSDLDFEDVRYALHLVHSCKIA